ncbi:MAG TPA: LPXTG cell wall anchor domain-containing protein [Candidatus Gracilibacteria bacterium]
MKQIFIWCLGSLVLWSFGISFVLADLPPLRTQDIVRVQGGRVRFSAVLADDNGAIFIEVPQNMIAKVAGQAHFNFDGFLLAPNVVTLPQKFPRARTREIVSFDFLSDDLSPVYFSDKFYRVPLKQRLFTENEKSKMITVYIPLYEEEKISKPELWYYDDQLTDDETDDEWLKVGGVFDKTSDPNVALFSAAITKTGVYTLVDRRPLPKDVANVDQNIIELADRSPFPSVDAPFDPSNIPVDTSFDQSDFSFENTGNVNVVQTNNSNVQEIPAIRPLPQEANEEGRVPISFQQFQDQQQSSQNQPSQGVSENQQGSLPGEDLLAPSVIFEETPPVDDGTLPRLTEDDILAEIARINSQQGPGSPQASNANGNSLQASAFDGDNLPKTGNEKTNIALLLALFILGGSYFWYKRERKEMIDETL